MRTPLTFWTVALAISLAIATRHLCCGATNTPAETVIDEEIAELEIKTANTRTNAALWVNLGDALMQKSRETPVRGLLARAETAYQKALQHDAKNEDAMVGLAWVLNTRHDFTAGGSWAEKALALNTNLPHAHALLGDAAVELGDYDTAFDHFQKSLDLRADLSSYSRAAHLLWLTGDDRKARWLMQKAIEAGGPYPENAAWCRAQLALMLWQNGALLPAEQQAAQALEQAPHNHQVLAAFARIKAARKDFAAAIAAYERAVALVPEHESLVALGELYALTGRREDAEKTYECVLALHRPGASHAHGGDIHAHVAGQGNAQLARFYADQDRNLDEALKEAQAAYRTFKNVQVTDTLAWCYYKKGFYSEARKNIRLAMRWKTPDAMLFYHAGLIHAKLGEREQARQFLQKALNLNPRFHPRHADLAVAALQDLSARTEVVSDPKR